MVCDEERSDGETVNGKKSAAKPLFCHDSTVSIHAKAWFHFGTNLFRVYLLYFACMKDRFNIKYPSIVLHDCTLSFSEVTKLIFSCSPNSPLTLLSVIFSHRYRNLFPMEVVDQPFKFSPSTHALQLFFAVEKISKPRHNKTGLTLPFFSETYDRRCATYSASSVWNEWSIQKT